MLADNLENWAKRERQEGEAKGETRGMATSLRSLIELKFDKPPAWAEARINAASNDQLKVWIKNTLTAETLKAVFTD